SIKPESVTDISITKEFYSISPEGVVIENKKRNEFKEGDKVRVTMTLENARDLNYVVLTDERSACFVPTLQISDYLCNDGIWTYNEVRNSKTSLFFTYLPKGKHIITYDCYVTRTGVYAAGIATVQSQYSPLITAHSGGALINVTQ
ncbi:MAG: hypothetical protein K2N03_05010, partial [Muribaculaceae bacterium]|nr:hypothetical protein [Muribaculaceae bacterium]